MDFALSGDERWGNPGPKYGDIQTALQETHSGPRPAIQASDRANQIFGFNGWRSDHKAVKIEYMNQMPTGYWEVGVSATIRVTLKDGTYHDGDGWGGNLSLVRSDAIKKARNEATAAALQQALRQFGIALGK